MTLRHVLLISRDRDDLYADVVLHQPLECGRRTSQCLTSEFRRLLRSIGFRRNAFSFSLEPFDPSDPSPVYFGQLERPAGANMAHLRRFRVKAGTGGHVHTSRHHFDRAQLRHLRDMIAKICDSLDIEASVSSVA